MSCCGQITNVRVPIELNNQSDVLKVNMEIWRGVKRYPEPLPSIPTTKPNLALLKIRAKLINKYFCFYFCFNSFFFIYFFFCYSFYIQLKYDPLLDTKHRVGVVCP